MITETLDRMACAVRFFFLTHNFPQIPIYNQFMSFFPKKCFDLVKSKNEPSLNSNYFECAV